MTNNKALVLCSGGVDSTTLLARAVNKYGAENVYALSISYGQKHVREIEAARAVAALPMLAEYCLPLVKVGGFMLALKGPDCRGELEEARNAIRILGGGEPKLVEYSLGEAGGRSLVVIPKLIPTAKKFPRQRVKISEKPL